MTTALRKKKNLSDAGDLSALLSLSDFWFPRWKKIAWSDKTTERDKTTMVSTQK